MKIIDSQDMYRKLILAEAPLYLQPAWMDIFSQDWSARIGLNQEGQPVWLWPYQKKSKYGVVKNGRIPFCQDNGPVFLEQVGTAVFDPEVHRWLSMTVVDDRRNVLDLDKMLKMAWRKEDRFYQFFDLGSYPPDFQAASRSKRNRMKKSRPYDFVRLEGIKDVYSLFLNFFHSLGYFRITTQGLVQWKRALDEHYDHYLFGLRDSEGNILSAQWMVGHANILYEWQVVRNPQFQNAYARELLLWHVIQWAKEYYRLYDLGGSSLPGVRKFNLEMGAEENIYPRYVRYRPEWMGKVFGH